MQPDVNAVDYEDYLSHYGIIRRSGRYPWGSGGNVQQRSRDFLGMVDDLKAKGLSESEIAQGFGMSTTDLRATRSIARNAKRASDIAMAERLKAKGYSNKAIAERMGLAGESSVRSLLAPGSKERSDRLIVTSEMLKSEMEGDKWLDVGIGVERHLGISRTQLDTALSILKSEGYDVISIQEQQVGNPANKTTVKVLVPEGTTYRDIVTNKEKIDSLAVSLKDDGSFKGPNPPESIDSSRVGVNYLEDGGADADGVIYVRPGVEDVSLGGAGYAQVRVAVDGTHYLKGMAVYKDDLPEGVDLVFNTNKSNTGNKLDAMKEMNKLPKLDNDGNIVLDDKGKPVPSDNVDMENPFGASIKPDGQRGVMNIVNEEGDWDDWSKNLASQMLSKQKPSLAKEQLDKTYNSKKEELDEILSLTNPAVKKTLLQSYADDVDSASVHLKAAALPRQATKVILPVNSLKDTEIYAPTFRDGERVALIRYPHGGTFEIPELTVNNKHPEAKGMLGNALDAVGINSNVAERLSGADFDGDTVLVIPNNSGRVKSTSALEGLKNFDPKSSFPAYEGMKRMTEKQKQQEMGNVSNLITDMTIKGAGTDEIAQAVRHSMVVIDAEKHNLNYKLSAEVNGIAALKEKYQGGANRGASTLISQSNSELRVPRRKAHYHIDPDTGEKIYNYTGEMRTETRTNKRTGETTTRQIPLETKSTKGAEAKDAHSLSSGTPIEKIYADHSNRLKALANLARKEMVNTKNTPYNPSARKVYEKEVSSLNSKLNVALKNAPLERRAQLLANAVSRAKRQANPHMDSDDIKKMEAKALLDARNRTGAGKIRVNITPTEWEAVQAGAVSTNTLNKILRNSDLDAVKKLATPRPPTVMTSSKQARAKALLASGRTPSEVADILGVAVSTLRSSVVD